MRAIRPMLVAVLLMGLVSPAAQAAFPGQNGRIAYYRGIDSFTHVGIYAVGPTGTGENQITNPPSDTADTSPAWSPDGTKIAFNRIVAGQPEIYVMNADGTGITQLTTLGDSNTNAPNWSPDGTKIAFHSGANVWIMDADGSDPHPLVAGSFPAWSPDGSKIALVSGTDIGVVNADGTDFELLTGGGPWDFFPDWAPDGSKITFESSPNGNFGQADVYVMNADGSNPVRLTPNQNADRFPAWSPDGSKIVYSGDFGNLHTVNPEGTGDVAFSVGGFESSWQPVQPGYPRPKSATPSRFSLVPAYIGCLSPNETHGPPLAYGSCSPPQQRSSELTVGTPDANGNPANFVASLRLVANAGDPATAADEADVSIQLSISDVRCLVTNAACPGGPGSDYDGMLLALPVGMRITDRSNTPPGPEGGPGTGDTQLKMPVRCVPTASTSTGSSCTLNTTADALLPGTVKEGKRTVWELNQIHVRDAGPNGTGYGAGCPPTCGDGDETLFLREGIFVP